MQNNIAEVVKKLTDRARVHGVELFPGESFISVAEKLLDRLDNYRDRPEVKNRLFVE